MTERIADGLEKQGLDVGWEANLITIETDGQCFTLTVNEVARPLADGEVPQWPS